MEKYTYQPLKYPDSIRLVVLQPAADLEATVECFLTLTTLSECEDDVVEIYSALSYVWGDAADTRLISVEGRPFEVTANLESALRHMRDPKRRRRLWADAICIDQGNNKEKSQQVSQMGSVYEHAQNTIIYLGESTEGTDRILQSFRSPNAIYNDPPDPQDWAEILQRPWFGRIWIYQELMFSREPWVQAGVQRVRWDRLRLGLYSPFDLQELEPWNKFQILANERDIFNKTSDYAAGGDFPRSLLRILDARRGLGVSDPRDMLFAHLGALSNLEGSGEAMKNASISVNYGKSVADVYEDIVRYLIQATGSYSVLSYVGTTIDNDHLPMASWAPNWMSRAPAPPYRRLRESLTTILAGFDKSTEIKMQRDHAKITELIMKECSSSLDQTWARSPLWITTSILACVGIPIGTISQISETITTEQASFNFRINDIIVTDTPVPYDKAARRVFEHWYSVLRPSMMKVYGLLYSEATLFSYRSIERLTERSIRAASGEGIPQSVEIHGLQKIAAHLFFHATQRNNLHYPHFLQGKRFGVLEDGTPVLVPDWARLGDTACVLLGDLTTPFILRSQESVGIWDSKVLNDEIREKMLVKLDTPVEHCEFVGECFADGWMFPDKAQWISKYEESQVSKPHIFVIH